MSSTEHAGRSRRAAAAIARLPAFKSGARVALYLSADREADTAPLIAAARRRNVRLFVPVVGDLRHRRLDFYPLGKRIRRGAFGIPVPHGAPHQRAMRLAPRWFALIIIPLVGIDADGRRLGMGGGFYDRALMFRRARRVWRGPWLAGLAFDCQRTGERFAEAWDVRLDSLATESGLQHFPQGQP